MRRSRNVGLTLTESSYGRKPSMKMREGAELAKRQRRKNQLRLAHTETGGGTAVINCPSLHKIHLEEHSAYRKW